MKYAVIGAGGQLGSDLCPLLSGEVTGLARERADVRNPEQVRETLQVLRPEVVVNCSAYNFVDRAETEPDAVFALNAWGPRFLATICRDLDCVLVHFSTDYVFGLEESRRVPYVESDAPGPVCAYGASKLTGEYFVRSICPKHFVIRTCGLYGFRGSGGKGTNFVETMLRLAGEGKPLRVVTDQICTPSYTLDVAKATIQLIQTGRFGLYQITNAGSCSWHEFASAIFEKAGIAADLGPITTKAYGAPARRPAYSVLSNQKVEALRIPRPRPWKEALAAYLAERERRGQKPACR